MAGEKDKIYTADELAEFFGVTRRTVWEWCKGGKLPGFKIGKEWKVRAVDLQKTIERKVNMRKETDRGQLL